MEFMIVAVSAFIGAAPIPATPPGATAAAPSAATAAVPQRHFSDEFSCEQAAKAVEAPPGTRLVCIPIGAAGFTAAY
jgi:hypothetical protein